MTRKEYFHNLVKFKVKKKKKKLYSNRYGYNLIKKFNGHHKPLKLLKEQLTRVVLPQKKKRRKKKKPE